MADVFTSLAAHVASRGGRALLAVVVGIACCLAPALLAPAQAAEGWKTVKVPDVWKRPPGEIARDGAGYAWYRCRVTIPESWRGQSLTLYAEAADDARVFFVNGREVGKMGEFPPRFRTSLGTEERFAIPAEATSGAASKSAL